MQRRRRMGESRRSSGGEGSPARRGQTQTKLRSEAAQVCRVLLASSCALARARRISSMLGESEYALLGDPLEILCKDALDHVLELVHDVRGHVLTLLVDRLSMEELLL